MQISKKQNGDLNAIITIDVKPEDYRPKVEETIKAYRKSASVPGFRPGHVPADMIRKKYGREVLVEELNKILSNELLKYLSENKIDVLGSPLPVQSASEIIFEDGRDFSFDYEIGLAPAVNTKLPGKIPYYSIQVDEKMVDDDINDLRRRYGKFSNPEMAEESSILYGEFNELDEQGVVKENGNKTTTTLSIEMIRNEDEKKKFIGVKKDDTVRFNPMMAFRNEAEVAATLKTDKKSPAMESDYNFLVKTVNKIEKAELNQELFDKALGEGVVSNEEELRAKIKEGIVAYFDKESDRKFQKDVRMKFLEENSIPLPEEFLKRMLKARQEKELSEQEFDHQFYHLIEDLRWNLITEKIAEEQSISVNQEEIKHLAEVMISQQYAQYGMAPPEDDKMEEIVKDYLQKDDSEERMERSLRGSKVYEYLKNTITLDRIELSYADFIAKMQEKTEHEVHHH